MIGASAQPSPPQSAPSGRSSGMRKKNKRMREVTEQERPRYMISVAAELVGMHPQTLRIYEAEGPRPPAPHGREHAPLLGASTSSGCRLIQRLTTELGLNLAGVEIVLRLEDELRKAHRRIERLERQLKEEIQNVHKTYRRELVLYPRRSLPQRQRKRDMDFNKLTLKSQEAVGAAQEQARRLGNPELYPEHLLLALLDQELPRRSSRTPTRCAPRPRRRCAASPRSRARSSSRASRPRSRACSTARSTRRGSSRTSTSRSSTCCSRSTPSRATRCSRRSRRCAAASASRRRIPRAPTRRCRSSAAT